MYEIVLIRMDRKLNTKFYMSLCVRVGITMSLKEIVSYDFNILYSSEFILSTIGTAMSSSSLFTKIS